MSSTTFRLALAALVAALLGAACGSDGGSVTPSSGSVTRPTQEATTSAETARPATTERPTATTERPTATTEAPSPPSAAPTTKAATPSSASPASSTAGATDEADTTWWPWLLAALAVAAVMGVILFLGRSRKASPWPARAAALLGESDEITTHLVGLGPDGLASVAGADANRLAGLMASVQQLMASAPDEPSRRALAGLQDPLRATHGALDAIALTPVAPSDAVVNDIREKARGLHSATSLARATLQPAPPGSPV